MPKIPGEGDSFNEKNFNRQDFPCPEKREFANRHSASLRGGATASGIRE
jgi:hypothetical protein